MNLTDLLIRAPLFKGCSKLQIETFLSTTYYRLRRRTADYYVAHMGDTCNDIIILIEGCVYTSMINNDKEVIIETITAPLVLAPAFVYGEVNSFPVNIVTKTDCTFLFIDKSAFLNLLHNDKMLMTNFIKILSDRCYRLSERIREENLQSLKERVIEYLHKHGKIDNVQWVARILGVARPSLSRVLSELRNEGTIINQSNKIILKKD